MELIHFDADLIFNERQVSCARESFSILKKRLHDAQLTLILEPPENEPSEMDDWKAKVHELINRREKLNFPSLRAILEEQREEADTVSDKLLGCKVRVAPLNRLKSQASNCTQEQVWEKMKRIELNKRLGTDCKAFGARTEGEILRTIENCTSSNSMHPTSRTLRRKSKISGPFTSTSPVPSWIGPGHYDKTEETIRLEAISALRSTCQKTVPREKSLSADPISSKNISRSRRGDEGRICDQPRDQKDKCALSLQRVDDKGDGRDIPSVSDIGRSPQQPSDSIRNLNNIRTHDRRGVKYRSKGNDRNDDRRNGMSSNLVSLVAALSKHVGAQSEMKDYTYGALSSLQSYSDNDLSEQHACAPHTNALKKMTVDTWDVRKSSSFTQPHRGDGAGNVRGVQSLSIGPSAFQNDTTHDPPKSARSPMQHSSPKGIHYSMVDGKDNNYLTSSAAAKHTDGERNAAHSAPVKFPSMETNLTPCIDQWYEDNGLHLPIRRLMLKRPEGFRSSASEMGKSPIRSHRKAATNSSSPSPSKAVHSPRSHGLLSSNLDMSGILLPDGAVDRAISSKLFSNARDFDLYIEEHKSRKDGQRT